MDWESIDWSALERLRAGFLASRIQSDYWQSESDLQSYDQTFAQRIGWKWDYVLRELTRLGWKAPGGEVLDWGCGSGVAGRAFVEHLGVASVSRLRLWDRSELAVRFASRRAAERFPGLAIEAQAPDQAAETLVLSHVLTELDEAQLEKLVDLAAQCTAVLWVEPGTHEASRRLSAVRDRLVNRLFHVIAPCTHRGPCPMLVAGNEAHWCHHFASPPAAVFRDSHWSRFAALAGVDLRSLPVSFLVLDKRPSPQALGGALRIIGRPRVYKAHALLFGCGESGLQERRLSKRHFPGPFRQMKKGEVDPLQVWECEKEEIVQWRALPGALAAERHDDDSKDDHSGGAQDL